MQNETLKKQRGSVMARFGLYYVCGETVGGFLCAQWERACAALDLPPGEAAASSDLLREVLDPWFAIEIGRECWRPSYVAEDGFPAEISVKWTGSGPELRVLFDIGFADMRPNLAALAATDRLAGRLGAALDDFGRVGGLLLDGRPGPPAPLWHSLVLRPGEPVSLKAYFGLYRWGMNEREAAVAMEILEMGAASSGVNTGKHELEFFALDLSDAPQSRAKVYYRGAAAPVEELNSLAGLAGSHDAARDG
ncbi:hypothetical protein ACH4C2_37805 [Streptomyces sp. NPDC018057]|uniref:hypothetical protein n=1 Tax=unclassified Streptomyces TaxID=2593676 RepID=UPI0037959D93